MNLYRSVRAVASASGDGVVDWGAAAEAAKGATNPGSLDVSDEERAGYATDVRDARDRVGEVAGFEFELPDQIEVQHRHHWIDANVDTFERLMGPLADRMGLFPGVARVMNTGSTSVALGFLARHVLGQYDPLLLAEADPADHGLYFVRPNIVRVSKELSVDYDRFRRWIAFHEVTHAAEFAAAPWLPDHLEASLEEAIENLSDGSPWGMNLGGLDTTMTAVEGYAELLMDRAFDDEYADLRRKLERRRQGGSPFSKLIRRLLGLDLKRRQYERGKEFFEAVADARGVEAAAAVWESPENLPTDGEIADPQAWIARVDPTPGFSGPSRY
ncbi:hypothetical protein BRD00_15100 [Halobacteriales archaeon QS_8_69_26]|nr:MAG: hypothetical protein BRD00_15100 [Halobacteriales archaeon QS_8_69_26]